MYSVFYDFNPNDRVYVIDRVEKSIIGAMVNKVLIDSYTVGTDVVLIVKYSVITDKCLTVELSEDNVFEDKNSAMTELVALLTGNIL